MIENERRYQCDMTFWIEENKEHIQEALGKLNKCKFLTFDNFNHRTQYKEQAPITNYDIVISYDYFNKLYIIWNPKNHGDNKQKTKYLSCTPSKYDYACQKHFYSVFPIIKTIKRNSKKEKVFIVKPEFIDSFCNHFIDYFDNDVNGIDNDYEEAITTIDKSVIKEVISSRNRYSCTRVERDAKFRSEVLEDYGNKCAICRCEKTEILQAAHIIAVKDGGTDDRRNGICLCANHHLMFDKKLIQFDKNFSRLTYVHNDLEQMPWHKEFIEKYNGKVVKRIQ